jgi:hypothetical protein
MNINWRSPWILASVIVLFLVLGYWGMSEWFGKSLELKIKNKKAIGHVDSSLPVNQTQAQPSILESSSQATSYNSHPISTPSPKPIVEEQVETVDTAPIVLVDDEATPTPSPTPKKAAPAETRAWLSEGRFIPCLLSNEMDSGHIGIPVILIVTENIYEQCYGKSKLIIHAGDRLMSFAGAGYHRDRITAEGEWHCIFTHEGTSISFKGALCDMEWDPASNEYGLYDKSPGIKGTIVQSDQFRWLRGLLGTLVTTIAQSAGQLGTAALQHGNESNNVNVDTTPYSGAVGKYVDMLVGGPPDVNDTVFVQVPAFKPCWVVTFGPMKPGLASIGASIQTAMKDQEKRERPEPQQNIQIPQIPGIPQERKEDEGPTGTFGE